MLSTANVNSTSFDILKRRLVKALRFGKSDTQTPLEVAPYGTDANPIKGMVAIYGSTQVQGQNVVIGYINKEQLAAVGEHRIYSTDSDGGLKFFVWLKNDGTCELGGDADNAVRYSPLSSELTTFKNAIQAELVKIQTAITSVGGVYTPGTLTIDISNSKIDEIKTL
jgi:hypothetical protein